MSQIQPNLLLEQQQKLFMTTELRQAISLLQMTSVELNDYIRSKIEENPFLEEEGPSEESEENRTEFASEIEEESNNYGIVSKLSIEEFLEQSRDNHINYFSDERQEEREEYPYERYLSSKTNLYEHLELQLNLEVKNHADVIIGNYLIGNIDSNGYLTVDLADAAKALGVKIKKVEEVLRIIQTFTPIGVGARNLQECLLIQLRYYGKDSELAVAVVQNYLKELGERKWTKIARELAVPVKKIQEVYDLIRTLDPKPGLQFGSDTEQLIIPDVTVIKDNGQYRVIVNDLDFPCLRINQYHMNLFKQTKNLTGDVKKYLEEKLESALGLLRGIEQRRLNIYKVVQCVVNIQRDFLDHGIEYLKPLTMSQVAQMINVHESTVSRVVSNKFVQTPRGIFALKYFFSSGVDSYVSSKVCSKTIKHLIREIINDEDPSNPLSDQEIMEILVNKGIKISRRTVNKYRQSMGIPTNLHRKRY